MRNSLVLIVLILSVILEGSLARPEELTFEEWAAALDPSSESSRDAARNSPACTGVSNGYYPFVPGQCDKDYYACLDGTQYNLTCADAGNVFNPAAGSCVPESNCISTTTKKPFDCSPPTPDGNYAIGSSCTSSYYACYGNVMYPQSCPSGSVFDPIKLQCVSPNVSSCASSTTIIATGPTTTLAPGATTTLAPGATTTLAPGATTQPQATTTPVPPPTVPTGVVCPGTQGFYQIKGYCGPYYYYCSGVAGTAPSQRMCSNPNYFDCRPYNGGAPGYCTASSLANCNQPSPVACANEI